MSPAPARAALLVLLLLVTACGNEPEPAPRADPAPALAPPAPIPAPAPRPDEPRLGPYPRSQFYIEHDLFIAADDPRCVPADEARFLGPEDEVLGLIVGGKARAYAVTMLSYHHVVNDVIEGIPVAVTY
jgi:hypothetical protein